MFQVEPSRRLLSGAVILCLAATCCAHERLNASGPPADDILSDAFDSAAVQIEIIEQTEDAAWPVATGKTTEQFTQPAFGLAGLPQRYSETAVRIDRSRLFVVRATSKLLLPAGRQRLLLRSMNAARVLVDGKELARTRFINANSDGHEPVPDLPQARTLGMRRLPVGHAEQLFTVKSDGSTLQFTLEAFVGGKKLRPELGELSLSIEQADGSFYLLCPHPDLRIALTDVGWQRYVDSSQRWLATENQQRRKLAGQEEDKYWSWRHAKAKEITAALPAITPPASTGMPANNAIDHFVNRRLADRQLNPQPQLDDWAFLRRVYLDTVGVVPNESEVERYLNDTAGQRRANVITRLLNDARWADHWVAYWQDVLAENPGILKPKINNTGPFRFWIHESFLDNKPVDRFASELIMMQGSKYHGGPAGFSMATQNDVPMGAKAHIIAQAFLAVDMKCARCHDAPFQDVQQEDLFALAAMLKRAPQPVPATSSIPLPAEEIAELAVQVSLKPGEAVEPAWPFEELIAADEPLDNFVRERDDSRERLAVLITHPKNRRFAQVIANRIWQRLLGAGLTGSVDNWENEEATHPELLAYLATELVQHNFDLKHLTALILQSDAYQREPAEGQAARWFAGPHRRRMTAEQIVDSLFVVSGKPLASEPLTLDLDGRRDVSSFLNLGRPSRAWQFTSLSNERDRPALAMPRAQSIVDVLENFGWRSSRQNPLTRESREATIQQPAVLANGLLTRRIYGLSEDHRLTSICVDATSVDQLADHFFLSILTRLPSDAERQAVTQLISQGFDQRVLLAEPQSAGSATPQHAVSWSNHLSAEATRIKLEMERLARAGDPPTRRLTGDWRERAEDAIWALTNSPEFIFVP